MELLDKESYGDGYEGFFLSNLRQILLRLEHIIHPLVWKVAVMLKGRARGKVGVRRGSLS